MKPWWKGMIDGKMVSDFPHGDMNPWNYDEFEEVEGKWVNVKKIREGEKYVDPTPKKWRQ